jgi:hypothetical protein
VSPRFGRLAAAALFGVYVLAVVFSLTAAATGHGTVDDAGILLAVGFAVVGLLVALREPGNSVGWLLLAAAVAFGLQGPAQTVFFNTDGFAASVAAWYSEWAFYVWLCCAGLLLPLLFPSGRLLSPRWRIVLAVDLAALVLSVLGVAFHPGALDVDPPLNIQNPFGAAGLLADVVTVLAVVGTACVAVGIGLSAWSFVLRLRRSRGREREQLKVFAIVIVAIAASVLVIVLTSTLGALTEWRWAHVVENAAWAPFLFLVILGLPIAVGVAILKHRLYDIDVVINRALVYGSLTAALVTTYVGLVLLLGLVLTPLTGTSDLAVAGSTLAVAALFRPVRGRIQAVVDQRFFRRRYDAARTLDEFANRLRHELDLDAVGGDLRDAVRDAVQPAHVSLWLRP